MGFLGTPLGWIMKFLYQFIPNYALVLVLFTLLVKLVLFPLNVKQQKNSAKMAIFNPKLKQLQKQYGKDKQRYQEEMMKLYEEEGYNPMSSCLPTILQTVVLFGIIDVVYRPLKHLLSIPSDLIQQATKALTDAGAKVASNAELLIVNIIQGNDKQYSAQLFEDIFSEDIIEKIQSFDISFLGLNLGEIPTWTFPILLIPIISGITSLLVSVFSMHQQKKNGMLEQQAGMGAMKVMMYGMPIFSAFIAFSLPAGAGFYWIVSNIFSLIQTIILYTVYAPEKIKEKVAKEMEEKKKSQKKSRYRQALEIARQQQAAKEAAQENSNGKANQKPKKESKKPLSDPEELTNSQILALARKRMADKYGDETDNS